MFEVVQLYSSISYYLSRIIYSSRITYPNLIWKKNFPMVFRFTKGRICQVLRNLYVFSQHITLCPWIVGSKFHLHYLISSALSYFMFRSLTTRIPRDCLNVRMFQNLLKTARAKILVRRLRPEELVKLNQNLRLL